jgi:hypothetical protein
LKHVRSSFECNPIDRRYLHFPCSKSAFPNRCAIRLGIALEAAGVDANSFDRLFPRRLATPVIRIQGQWDQKKETDFISANFTKVFAVSELHMRGASVYCRPVLKAEQPYVIYTTTELSGGLAVLK